MQILTPTLRDFIAFEPLSGSRPRGWENVRARRAVCRFIRTILDLLALVEEGQRGREGRNVPRVVWQGPSRPNSTYVLKFYPRHLFLSREPASINPPCLNSSSKIHALIFPLLNGNDIFVNLVNIFSKNF